jgi:hypothetical protein
MEEDEEEKESLIDLLSSSFSSVGDEAVDPFDGILSLYGYDKDDESIRPEDIVRGTARMREHEKQNAADPDQELFNPVRELRSYIEKAKFDRQGRALSTPLPPPPPPTHTRRDSNLYKGAARKIYRGLTTAERERDERRYLAMMKEKLGKKK